MFDRGVRGAPLSPATAEAAPRSLEIGVIPNCMLLILITFYGFIVHETSGSLVGVAET